MGEIQNLTPKEQLALIDIQANVVEGEAEQLEMPEQTAYTKIKKSDRPLMIALGIQGQYDIIKILHPLSFWYKKHEDFTYSPLPDEQIQNWARDHYLQLFGTAEVKDVRNTAEMIRIMTRDEIDKIDRTWIEVVKNKIYWNCETGELKDEPNAPCFWRLFDTSVEGKHAVKVPAFTEDEQQALWDKYYSTISALEKGREMNYEPYQFITTWAKGNHDVYLDIVRAIAYCFVKKKPVGSYVLVGLRRNGKSSFVGLLHTIFGTNNTSTVRLSQLGDPHYTLALSRTLLNAPDEEDEKTIDAQANFKTLSDHGVLNLSVMYSQTAESVVCDFMNFFPMNHIPEWAGSGASACMKRTLVIPFYADLSAYDKKNFNFAKETFTSDFMAEFMGYIFAFAYYYSRHDLAFSPTMQAAQESIEEDLDSAVVYRTAFERYYDGFSTLKFLFEDYCNYCKAKDMVIRPRKEFKFVFREYMTTRVYYSPSNSPKRFNLYRIPQPGHVPMFEDMGKTPVGDVNYLHDCGASLVERMDAYYEEKKWRKNND